MKTAAQVKQEMVMHVRPLLASYSNAPSKELLLEPSEE